MATFLPLCTYIALFSSAQLQYEKHVNNLNCSKEADVLALAENTPFFCSERGSH